MLLAAPLTTKLYMHFVKDVKDKSQVGWFRSEVGTGKDEGPFSIPFFEVINFEANGT